MNKCFNITGPCNPEEHYMVKLDGRISEIKKRIDGKKYFSINRGRQYGKTTTLFALKKYLQADYTVVSLDFQFLTQEDFRDEYAFSSAFARRFALTLRHMSVADREVLAGINSCANSRECGMGILFERLSDFCSAMEKPVVLLIDEVDNASNNQVFLDFLALLRGYYIHREEFPTFQSVILAGVYDIRKLRQKIRLESDHKDNSPWNIAMEFNLDMSLSEDGIREMLTEYEQDCHTGMDIGSLAKLLYEYTSGYPFLVSKLCQLMDERISGKDAWTKNGFLAAMKLLLTESNPLLESLVNKLNQYPLLRKLLYSMLFLGNEIAYHSFNDVIEIASMFGFITNQNGTMAVANRVFETVLYNLFLSEEEISGILASPATLDKNQFVKNGILDMELLMEKFAVHWDDLYRSTDEKFIEENGRKFFLLYLRPVINGVGNYYIESRTRDHGRTDIIVDYRGHQYIIEIKIWHGEEYNRRGEQQLASYLESYHVQKGYLLSFNFNKNKIVGKKEVRCGDKVIFEVVV